MGKADTASKEEASTNCKPPGPGILLVWCMLDMLQFSLEGSKWVYNNKHKEEAVLLALGSVKDIIPSSALKENSAGSYGDLA